MVKKRYKYISIVYLENLDDRKEQKIIIMLGYVRKKLQRCKRQILTEDFVDCSERCLQTVPMPNYMFENEIDEYIKENYDDDIFKLETWKKEIQEHKEKYWNFL